MSIEQWWAKLQSSTQEWLIENNGDVVPPPVVAEIAEAGGPASGDSWWASQAETPGHYFPDDAIDWVETTANDEEAEWQAVPAMAVSQSVAGIGRPGKRVEYCLRYIRRPTTR